MKLECFVNQQVRLIKERFLKSGGGNADMAKTRETLTKRRQTLGVTENIDNLGYCCGCTMFLSNELVVE